MLGFTQVSWDNLSGQLPIDFFLFWAEMTENQKAAAGLLGYTQMTWDNDSGSEPRPASAFKSWSELTVCDDGEDLYFFNHSATHPGSHISLSASHWCIQLTHLVDHRRYSIKTTQSLNHLHKCIYSFACSRSHALTRFSQVLHFLLLQIAAKLLLRLHLPVMCNDDKYVHHFLPGRSK